MTRRGALGLLPLVGLLLLASGFGAQDVTDLQITETASPAQEVVHKVPEHGNITWTVVVMNNGLLADTNVQVSDPLPVGNDYVTATTTTGTCSGGANLSCSLGTMAAGDSATITLVTTPTITGVQVNTPSVSGDLAETTVANNTASASVLVVGCHGCGLVSCTAVDPRPKQLYVAKSTTMHLKVMRGHQAVRGVRVRITGPGIFVTTRRSNAKGEIERTLKPTRSGIASFTPIVAKSALVCKARVGITQIGPLPVTG